MMQHYVQAINTTLRYIQHEQQSSILTAANWLSETLINDGLLYVTGTGHSHMIAEEVFYRAGGLAAVYPILEPALMLHEGAIKSTDMERLEGLASILLCDLPMNQHDVLIVASNSGRNAFPIEVVLEAKTRGCKTIAITSLAHSQQTSSRHSSNKRLFEVADLVIDNGVAYGDAALEMEGLSAKMGPVSSIAGIFIINSIVLEATALCLRKGYKPDVFVSANVQTSQQTLDIDSWKQRIKRL